MIRFLGKEAALLLFTVLFIAISTSAQKSPRHCQCQLTIVSENDNYTFKYKDRYYTNGLAIRFAKTLGNESYTGVKKVLATEVGQMIFIPFRANLSFRSTMDRPFTGLLYAKGGLSYYSIKNDVLRWNLLAGVIGNDAFGKEVQRWHHKNFNLPYPYGWETQLKSEFGANLQATYYRHLLKPSANNFFEVHAKAEVQAGTFFTQLSSGLMMKLGAFENAGQSAFGEAGINARSGTTKRNHELFLYFEPQLTYQLYNATVQGGLLTHNEDVYTTGIQPYYYSHRFGAIYAQGGLSLQLGFTYKTKEARTMRADENYGTIGVGVRF
ncbi:lipid A deacylase LpxR family protein [Chitinophagaceae bacterium LB-8]|uniref:Lipid A deacylase LpxR family protein n=1 Tax=Paraflavisolibacter caeni TaxID=2982496 RepID=A0A9X3B9C0_9BACT|nr:lipid A deacylase LpxR family protein [Paraflavisolibacter caeni]MCU7551001.1 lipid A deacylase LpxR family protein [Paraflavisolibacter caeni]